MSNIDFEDRLVIVESLKKRRKGVYRAIPLPASLLAALKKLISQEGAGEDDRLWPWSRMTGYRRITEVMGKAGINGAWASPKGLRHAFGVRAVQSGAPLHMVQRWLGHADMKTTAIYANAVGPEEREIAARTWRRQDVGKDRVSRPSAGASSEMDQNYRPSRGVPTAPSPRAAPLPARHQSWLYRLFARKSHSSLAT